MLVLPRLIVLVLALFALGPVTPSVFAQSTPPVTPSGPGVKLTPAQRQLIYASISKQTHKSTAAPLTFGATVGAVVPEPVELTPMPETIVDVVPQTRGYSYAFVSAQVLIVDPKSRQIIEVISENAT